MKRIFSVFALISICLAFLLFAGGCKKRQEKSQSLPPPVKHEAAAETTLLATIPLQDIPAGSDGQLPQGHARVPSGQGGPPPGHASITPDKSPEFLVYFGRLGWGAAYIAERAGKVHVVHNGKPGKLYDEISTLTIVLSDDGQRIAYGARSGARWMMVIDGTEEGPYDEVGSAVFSPDNRHIAYEVRKGIKWHVVSGNEMNAGCNMYYNKPMFSGDSSRILTIENTEVEGKFRLVVSDLAFEKQRVKLIVGNFIFTNEDKTRIGVLEDVNGKQRVIELDFNTLDVIRQGMLYDSIRFPVFGADGVSISYAAAQRQGGGVVFRYLILNNRRERLPDDAPMEFPVVRPDKKGAGIIMSTRTSYYLHQAFYNDGTKKKFYDEAGELTYSRDGSLHALIARKAKKIFVVVNGNEGPAFDHVITPVFSPDGKKIVYRARKGGKRFVVVADAHGRVLRRHPSYERIFAPVFTADGKSVAYGVKDGDKISWKVEKL